MTLEIDRHPAAHQPGNLLIRQLVEQPNRLAAHFALSPQVHGAKVAVFPLWDRGTPVPLSEPLIGMDRHWAEHQTGGFRWGGDGTGPVRPMLADVRGKVMHRARGLWPNG